MHNSISLERSRELAASRMITPQRNCSCHQVVRPFMGCPRARSRFHAKIGARGCIRTISRGWTPSLAARSLMAKREFVLEFRIFRHGQVRWIESRVLISYNEAGKPVRRIGAKIDVTERKQAEQALAERNIQLTLAAKAGLVGTYAYDADTEIMQISDGYAAIHGFPEGTTEIARSECLAGVHPDDIGRVEQFRSEAFRERRREYNVEYRIIRPGGELRWVETRCFISFSGEGHPHRVVGVSIDITERKRVEEQQRTLLAELDHRVKNALATVSAVVSHTWQGSRSVADFVAALDGRIRSMATTHELLSSRRWQGVSLTELVRRELAPYATRNNTEINGPDILLKPEAGQAMAMVLHELATNAAKYGALSTKNGRVSIRWDRHLNGHPRSHLVFEWQEIGGPPVVALGKSSYGTSTIRDLIPYEFGGTVDLVLAPEGVRCRLELPAEWLGNDRQPFSGHRTCITANRRSLNLRLATGLSKTTGERACVASALKTVDAPTATARREERIGEIAKHAISRTRLTQRELSVLKIASDGRTMEEIAGALSLGVETVRSHFKKAKAKLGARNRTHAVAEAMRQLLIV